MPRTSLLDRLVTAGPRPGVVLVVAPPGYGKSTLLAQWDAADPRVFARLALDEADNDPAALLHGIVGALEGVVPLDPAVVEWGGSPRPQFGRTIVPRLTAALTDAPAPFVLAFDDGHLVTDPDASALIGRLIEHTPEGSTIAVAGRAEPRLPLARLRATGGLLDVGPDDLAFDLDESRDLVRAAGADLDGDELEDVHRSTEGWAVALYLAALAHRDGVRRGRQEPFRGDDRLVGDYLRSEVLARLTEDEVGFLTRSSVLRRMSGPVCDEVLGRTGSAAVLERLEAQNRLIVPLDRHREWYRYHHLFRDLLAHELSLREPEARGELVRRASVWCERDGSTELAIEYAREAGDVDRVAALVARVAQPMFVSGRSATILGWTRWLEERGCEDAALAVTATWLTALTGRPADATRWMEAAERRTVSGSLPDGTGSIEAWIDAASAALCRGGVKTARDDAARALSTLSAASPWRPAAGVVRGLCEIALGDRDAADLALRESAEVAEALGVAGGLTQALGIRAALAIDRQAWDVAAELTRRARDVVQEWRLEGFLTSAVVGATAAQVAVHEGDPQRARDCLSQVEPVRSLFTVALPHVAVHGLSELAKAYLGLSDLEAADGVVADAEVIVARSADLGTLATGVVDLRAHLDAAHREVPGVRISPAELRVLPLLATHLSFREIGEQLFVSQNTVKTQAISIYRKLGVSSRSAAIDRARELGIIPPADPPSR